MTQALTLPDEQQFRHDIQAINQFQAIVRANMREGHDYGVIPGTQKPTLLKPGAEKIAKLLGLADLYEIMDRQEDWGAGFFRYLIKCRLVTVRDEITISEGLGECNSMESKYRWRWVGERDLPEGTDKSKLVSQERHSRQGGKWRVYRFDNEDIYSQVNTLLKMAKKRALVDAALSAGRLSEVFTQDIEDMSIAVETADKPNPQAKPKSPDKPPVVSNPPAPEASDDPITEPSEQADPPMSNLGDLFTACHKAYGFKQADVLKELGGIAKEDIGDVKDAWEKIKASKLTTE